jgi:hypothetical protein
VNALVYVLALLTGVCLGVAIVYGHARRQLAVARERYEHAQAGFERARDRFDVARDAFVKAAGGDPAEVVLDVQVGLN